MKPFFSYYGAKWRMSAVYPEPKFQTLIEPFAGSACYATRFFDRQIVLYDVNPVVCSVWDYLIKATADEVLRLPIDFQHLDEISVSQEAKWLIGFWLNKACVSPMKSKSKWARSGLTPTQYWGESIRQRIASQVGSIRHWKVFNKSYHDIENQQVTWLVDPPYAGQCGTLYPFRKIDYVHLGDWCRERNGQVIVCERQGADWLPFEFAAKVKATEGTRGKKFSNEAVWIKEDPPCSTPVSSSQP